MAWQQLWQPNTGFYPAGYQPYQQFQPVQQPAPGMSPPTVRADIVQVADEAEAERYAVGAGASQMMIARDDSAIFIKTAAANGETSLAVYERRPPAPPAPTFDPALYVRRDEVESIVAAALQTAIGGAAVQRKEVAHEPV